MSDLGSLLSGADFQSTVERYASENGWKIAEISTGKAILRFSMRSGRTQTVFIIRYETTLEFSVPSALSFASVDDVPHYLSTLLLQRNRQPKVGFWCIEEISGKQVFSCMHNAELKLIDSSYFGRVINALVTECDDFEEVLEDMAR